MCLFFLTPTKNCDWCGYDFQAVYVCTTTQSVYMHILYMHQQIHFFLKASCTKSALTSMRIGMSNQMHLEVDSFAFFKHKKSPQFCFQLNSLTFCELKPRAKFDNPRTNPSGRKFCGGGRGGPNLFFTSSLNFFVSLNPVQNSEPQDKPFWEKSLWWVGGGV